MSGRELVGSQAYLAPEQRRGFPPTARADLYAWGLVFLECLTGRRAGRGGPPEGAALQRDGREPVRMPRALLDHPLGTLLRRATVEEVAARDVTADGLLREVDACDVGGLRREDLVKPDELAIGAARRTEERPASAALPPGLAAAWMPEERTARR